MSQPESPTPAPPFMVLFQMATGHYFSRALALATKLGIADHLGGGPRSAADLAAATETNAAALQRVLRLLASVGVFKELDDQRFGLTPLSEMLRRDQPGSMWAMVQLFAGVPIQDGWRELEFCVRTGEPAFKLSDPDGDAFTHMAKNPEQLQVFDEAMATFAPMTVGALTAAYDFSVYGTIVDVGGGNGSLLLAILQANPQVRGIVFDLPHVADKAKAKIEAEGLAGRCRAVGGSMFEKVPEGGDAYLLKHVIHDWNDEQAIAILRHCRTAMGKQGKLLIAEGVYPERIERNDDCRGAASNDVNMLVCTGGRQRSESEFRALYQAAGLRLTRIVPTFARVSVVEGEPA